jgi:hypothetical protein
MRYLKEWLSFLVVANVLTIMALCLVNDVPNYWYLAGIVIGNLAFIVKRICVFVADFLEYVFKNNTDEI